MVGFFPLNSEIGGNPPLTKGRGGIILCPISLGIAVPGREISNLVGSSMPEKKHFPQRIAYAVEPLASKERRDDLCR